MNHIDTSGSSSDEGPYIGYKGFYSPIDDNYSDEERMMVIRRGVEEMKRKRLEWDRIEKEKEDRDMMLFKQTLVESDSPECNKMYTNVDDSSDEDHSLNVECISGVSYRQFSRRELSSDDSSDSSFEDNLISQVSLCDEQLYRNPTEYSSSSDEEKVCEEGRIIIPVICSSSSEDDQIHEEGVISRGSCTDDVWSESSSDEESVKWTPQKTQEVSKKLGLSLGYRKPRRLYTCSFSLCKFKTTHASVFEIHMNRHNGVKPHACTHEWCDYRGTTKGDIRQHLKNVHNRDGFIKKLKEEYRVIRKLKEWGLNVDTDITIDASRNGCVPDVNRKYSRVDMVVLNVTSCILILEVDEFAHEGPTYNIPCELSRMVDIAAFLRLNSYTKPIFWLRYNPNGKYFIGKKEKKVSRETREFALKQKIFSMMEPDFVPKGNENIHYMFYPRVSESGPPKILENSQYPGYVKNIVSWGE